MRQNARLILKAAPVPGSTCGVEIREGSPFGPVLGFRKIPDKAEPGADGTRISPAIWKTAAAPTAFASCSGERETS